MTEPMKGWRCGCGYVAQTGLALRNHRRWLLRAAGPAAICDQAEAAIITLKHYPVEPCLCACGKTYGFPSALQRHMHRANNQSYVPVVNLRPEPPSEDPPGTGWRCSCGVIFATKRGLRTHRGHTMSTVCRQDPTKVTVEHYQATEHRCACGYESPTHSRITLLAHIQDENNALAAGLTAPVEAEPAPTGMEAQDPNEAWRCACGLVLSTWKGLCTHRSGARRSEACKGQPTKVTVEHYIASCCPARCGCGWADEDGSESRLYVHIRTENNPKPAPVVEEVVPDPEGWDEYTRRWFARNGKGYRIERDPNRWDRYRAKTPVERAAAQWGMDNSDEKKGAA